MVLSRPCHPDDQFTTSILRHWCMKHDELLAEHIKSLLIKNNSLPRKRQRWDGPVGIVRAGAGRAGRAALPGWQATSSGLRRHAGPPRLRALFPEPCGRSPCRPTPAGPAVPAPVEEGVLPSGHSRLERRLWPSRLPAA